MNYKVIFFTCTYNKQKTLRKAIDSILAQTYENWIYYVLDNGCTDGTSALIREYEKKDSRIIGLSAAKNDISNILHTPFQRNNLLPGVEYDWLAILDSDDEYAPTFAEKCLAYANQNELDMVCTSSSVGHCAELYLGLHEDKIFSCSADYEDFPSWYKLWLPAWSKLYHRSVVDKMNKDRVTIYDGEAVMEAMLCSKKMGVISEVLYHYRRDAEIKETQRDRFAQPSEFYAFYVQLPDYLLNVGRRFFKEKCGLLTKRSEDILFYIVSTQTKNIIHRIFEDDAEFWMDKKINCIKKIMESNFMCELLSKENYGHEMKVPEVLLRSRTSLIEDIALKIRNDEELTKE